MTFDCFRGRLVGSVLGNRCEKGIDEFKVLRRDSLFVEMGKIVGE